MAVGDFGAVWEPGIQGVVLMPMWTGDGCTQQPGGEGAGGSCG